MHRRRTRAALAALLAALAGVGTEAAGAAARPRHSRKQPAPPAATAVGVPAVGASDLQKAVGLEVGRALRQTAALGVHVLDTVTGETVYTYNGDEPRVTASNTKLFTTAAALDALGPGYLYETRLLLRGALADGVLHGDLGVVGGGDPSFSGRAFDGDPYGAFRAWAQDLAVRGVRRVDGDLYLDAGLFEPLQIHPDWPPEQRAAWYEAPVSALAFNDNCQLVQVWPGAHGGLARVETVPPVHLFLVENSARTTNSRRHNHINVMRQEDRLIVSGTIYQQSGPLEEAVTVPDPVRYFGLALIDALAESGIEVRGRPRQASPLPGPVWERVAVYRSSLLEAVRIANKRSQNFYAESLVKLLGARRCGAGSWRDGVKAVGEFLIGMGVPATAFHMTDGSGLSHNNHFTPRATAQLLRHMYYDPWGEEFVQSLPGSGDADGSLRQRLKAPPYRGNVFAKTGTIEGVSALSGYARALSGRVYAFSILLNHTRGLEPAHQAQDHIVMALIDHG